MRPNLNPHFLCGNGLSASENWNPSQNVVVFVGGGWLESLTFVRTWIPNLKVGDSIPDAITSANLDFHCCDHQRPVPIMPMGWEVKYPLSR